ncbi:DUF6456 domain-containing protein [Sphingorhabdus sp. EL138]|uniref:DUF6456 domain-containing protein n=1 Tax=Sphingorhabdus sp. EL138 TaxID=2073156 RepID=UPI0025E413AD|nr:DUF6456 domain-containing protein [Sphingorhabdus sp. EL138]
MPAKCHSNRKFYDRRMLVENPVAESPASRRTVTINLSESPLSWLHARGYLSNRQMLAGEILRGDYEAAALGPHVTMSWENIPRSRQKRGAPSGLNRTERMIQAKSRFDGALTALGPDLSDIAWRVICIGESVPAGEREMSWPVRSGKLVLKIALDRLAAFYRITG